MFLRPGAISISIDLLVRKRIDRLRVRCTHKANISNHLPPLDIYPPGVYTGSMTNRDSSAQPHGYTPNKEAHLKRLRRIEGQVRGIARMVEEDKYCIDVLTQVAAVSKALHAVSLNLLEEHMGHCVTNAAIESERTGDATIVDEKIKEATAAISRMMRS